MFKLNFLKKKQEPQKTPVYENRKIIQNMERGLNDWERADEIVGKIKKKKSAKNWNSATWVLVLAAILILVGGYSFTHTEDILGAADKVASVFDRGDSERDNPDTSSVADTEDCKTVTVEVSPDEDDPKKPYYEFSEIFIGSCYIISGEDQGEWKTFFSEDKSVQGFADFLIKESKKSMDREDVISAIRESLDSNTLDLR